MKSSNISKLEYDYFLDKSDLSGCLKSQTEINHSTIKVRVRAKTLNLKKNTIQTRIEE